MLRIKLFRTVMPGKAEMTYMTGMTVVFTHITGMTILFTSNILFSLVKQRTSLHRPIMTGIAEITHITRMTVVFTSNILFSLFKQELVYIGQI